ncbi:ARID/BRIGHT DNA binding domain protein, partial [Trichinella nativa]
MYGQTNQSTGTYVSAPHPNGSQVMGSAFSATPMNRMPHHGAGGAPPPGGSVVFSPYVNGPSTIGETVVSPPPPHGQYMGSRYHLESPQQRGMYTVNGPAVGGEMIKQSPSPALTETFDGCTKDNSRMGLGLDVGNRLTFLNFNTSGNGRGTPSSIERQRMSNSSGSSRARSTCGAKESHPPTPAPTSPGGTSSVHDDIESSLSSPSWPRTPLSPAVHRAQSSSHISMGPPGSSNQQQQVGCSTMLVPNSGNCSASGSGVGAIKEGQASMVARLLGDPSLINSTGEEWAERKSFFERLIQFSDSYGHPITSHPTVSKQTVDLHKLYMAVKARGGFEEVTKKKYWRDLCVIFNIGVSNSASGQLKKQYSRFLFPFECVYDLGGVDPQPILASLESKKKNKNKAANVSATDCSSSVGSSNSNYGQASSDSSFTKPYEQVTGSAGQFASQPGAFPVHQAGPQQQQPPAPPQQQHGVKMSSTSMAPPPAQQQQLQSTHLQHLQANTGGGMNSEMIARDPFDDRQQTHHPHPHQQQSQPQQGQPSQPTAVAGAYFQCGGAPPPFVGRQFSGYGPERPLYTPRLPLGSSANCTVGPGYAGMKPYSAAGQPVSADGSSFSVSQVASLRPSSGNATTGPFVAEDSASHVATYQSSPALKNAHISVYPVYNNGDNSASGMAPTPVGPQQPSSMQMPATYPTQEQQQPQPMMRPAAVGGGNVVISNQPWMQSHVTASRMPAPSLQQPVSGTVPGLSLRETAPSASQQRSSKSSSQMQPLASGTNSGPVVTKDATSPMGMKSTVTSQRREKQQHQQQGVVFPPECIEATQVMSRRRKKYTAKDIGVTWGLNVLNVLLYDDSSAPYFNLNSLPGFLDALVEVWKQSLLELASEMGIQLPTAVVTNGGGRGSGVATISGQSNGLGGKRMAISGQAAGGEQQETTDVQGGVEQQPQERQQQHQTKSTASNNGSRCFCKTKFTLNTASLFSLPSWCPFEISSDRQRNALDRCLSASNALTGLSYIPGNEHRMAKCGTLVAGLASLINLDLFEEIFKPLSFRRLTPDENIAEDSEAMYEGGKCLQWNSFLDGLKRLVDDAFVILCNLSPQLELDTQECVVVGRLLDALLNWATGRSSMALDPLSGMAFVPPNRYALEVLCKMSVVDKNVDLMLATPPWSRIELLLKLLASHLSIIEEVMMREFAVALMHAFCLANPVACVVAANQTPAVQYLVSFLDQADCNMHQVVSMHGMPALRENPELMGTSVGMLRRAATTLLFMARIPACRARFAKHHIRLLHFTMSSLMDSRVASTIADVLYELHNVTYDEEKVLPGSNRGCGNSNQV